MPTTTDLASVDDYDILNSIVTTGTGTNLRLVAASRVVTAIDTYSTHATFTSTQNSDNSITVAAFKGNF
jgi:hypothetical protein